MHGNEIVQLSSALVRKSSVLSSTRRQERSKKTSPFLGVVDFKPSARRVLVPPVEVVINLI